MNKLPRFKLTYLDLRDIVIGNKEYFSFTAMGRLIPLVYALGVGGLGLSTIKVGMKK